MRERERTSGGDYSLANLSVRACPVHTPNASPFWLLAQPPSYSLHMCGARWQPSITLHNISSSSWRVAVMTEDLVVPPMAASISSHGRYVAVARLVEQPSSESRACIAIYGRASRTGHMQPQPKAASGRLHRCHGCAQQQNANLLLAMCVMRIQIW